MIIYYTHITSVTIQNSRDMCAKYVGFIAYGNQMLITLLPVDLLDQSCKRDKFLNHEAVSRIESDIVHEVMK